MIRDGKFSLGIVKCVLVGMIALAAIGSAPLAVAASYDELLAQAKSNSAAVDYTALRYAYAESEHYNPYDPKESESSSLMLKAFGEKDCPNAVKHAQAVLENDYVSINAHIVSDLCFRQTGEPLQAKIHEQMVRGLVQSILASGDGKGPNTAFIVIAVDEEYGLLSFRGMKKVKQALISVGDHRYDQISVENRSGGAEEIFFNIDRPAAWFLKHDKAGGAAH